MYTIIGYQREKLEHKAMYYRACGDERSVLWFAAPGTANFRYRAPNGDWAYGISPETWLLETGAEK